MERSKEVVSYLLDTHIWIWSMIEPNKLSSIVRKILEDENSEFYLSSISVWETVMLGEKKRIVMDRDPIKWVKHALSLSPVIEAPVTHSIALTSRSFGIDHKDPADRFILATAREFGIRLITADEALWKCKGVEFVK